MVITQKCLIMRSVVYVSSVILVLFYCPAKGTEISFLKYCTNESNPDPLPTTGSDSSGSIVMNTKPGSNPWYLPDLNCTVTLSTERGFHIFVTFSNVSLRNSSMDNLTVFYNNDLSNIALAGQQVCSNENCEGLKFESGKFNNMTLKFISANVTVPLNVTGFKAHYTVYDFADSKTGACKGNHRFLCENKHCVQYDLACDGHNNCGDFSDETKCIIPVRNTVWGIIVIIVAIISIIIFVPLFIFLATSGTRSIVKSVTLLNQPTPLTNAADCGETSGLLTSSEAMSNCWPGTSYDRSYSFSYGTAQNAESTDVDVSEKKQRSASEVQDVQVNKFL